MAREEVKASGDTPVVEERQILVYLTYKCNRWIDRENNWKAIDLLCLFIMAIDTFNFTNMLVYFHGGNIECYRWIDDLIRVDSTLTYLK